MHRPTVTFTDDEMAVRFDRFGMDSYDLFLRVKAIPEQRTEFDPDAAAWTVLAPKRFASLLGATPPARAGESLPLADYLFDDQKHIVAAAVEAKRFAVWSDCGLGKTPCGLEWARQVGHRTGGRVLVVTLNEIVPQWVEMAGQFYGDALPVVRLQTRDQVREWCRYGTHKGATRAAVVAVTNYEKFNHKGDEDQVVNEVRHLAGLVLDESSRLKTGGGKQKWAVIKSGKGVEYKLSLTATPAPNEPIEFASQASFLEKMRSDNEIIWTYFRRDPDTDQWDLRPHARAAFFEFMSSWSIYVRDPKRYGWRLNLPDVPEPEYVRVPIDPTQEQLAEADRIMTAARAGETPSLVANRSANAIERVKLSQVAKGFVYGGDLARKNAGGKLPRQARRVPSAKPDVVAGIIEREAAAGAQVLVWTVFDGESAILAEKLLERGVGFDLLTGATPDRERAKVLARFKAGESRVLVSRAALLGFGMNFQMCTAMVFSGWNDSYEAFYQAVRRAVRHGQTQRVRVHLPFVRGLEEETLENLDRKAAQMEQAIEEMERNYVRVLRRAA